MTYTMIENTPGYLPEDDDPLVTDDLDTAKEYLAERVQSYGEHLDEVDEPYEARWSDDRLFCHVVRIESPHDLGRVFEVVETPIG